MNHKGTIQLETERLILRRFTIEDAPAMFKNWASDPEVTKFMTWPTHQNVGVSQWVLNSWIPSYEKADYYVWAIILKENGNEPIGNFHGLPKDDIEAVEFGYALGRKWWHKGIMTEVLRTVIDFFFEQVGANSVRAYHDPNNPNSGMVMKKCGMKYEGTLRSADRNNQGIVDQSWYSLLRSEWETNRLNGNTITGDNTCAEKTGK